MAVFIEKIFLGLGVKDTLSLSTVFPCHGSAHSHDNERDHQVFL